MSQATAQFDATNAPVANVTVQGQIGPNIQGSGMAQFVVSASTFYLFLAQAGNATVGYGVNSQSPTTPLQPNDWDADQRRQHGDGGVRREQRRPEAAVGAVSAPGQP